MSHMYYTVCELDLYPQNILIIFGKVKIYYLYYSLSEKLTNLKVCLRNGIFKKKNFFRGLRLLHHTNIPEY